MSGTGILENYFKAILNIQVKDSKVYTVMIYRKTEKEKNKTTGEPPAVHLKKKW